MKIQWESEDSQHTVEFIHYLKTIMRFGLFNQLEFILYNIPYTTASPITMITILRVTSRIREKLPSWKDVTFLVHTELIKRGENADRIMEGLMGL